MEKELLEEELITLKKEMEKELKRDLEMLKKQKNGEKFIKNTALPKYGKIIFSKLHKIIKRRNFLKEEIDNIIYEYCRDKKHLELPVFFSIETVYTTMIKGGTKKGEITELNFMCPICGEDTRKIKWDKKLPADLYIYDQRSRILPIDCYKSTKYSELGLNIKQIIELIESTYKEEYFLLECMVVAIHKLYSEYNLQKLITPMTETEYDTKTPYNKFDGYDRLFLTRATVLERYADKIAIALISNIEKLNSSKGSDEYSDVMYDFGIQNISKTYYSYCVNYFSDDEPNYFSHDGPIVLPEYVLGMVKKILSDKGYYKSNEKYVTITEIINKIAILSCAQKKEDIKKILPCENKKPFSRYEKESEPFVVYREEIDSPNSELSEGQKLLRKVSSML